MCRRRLQVGFCALGLTSVGNAGALQQWPTLEVKVGPPSEVVLPLEVESPLDVALLWLGREEETLEWYFASGLVHVGHVPVGWWGERLSEVQKSVACVV